MSLINRFPVCFTEPGAIAHRPVLSFAWQGYDISMVQVRGGHALELPAVMSLAKITLIIIPVNMCAQDLPITKPYPASQVSI